MRKLLPFLGIAALAASAAAQQAVIPNGMDTGNPGTTTLLWRNTAFHFQCLYDPAHFLDQGINYPITISRLQFRAAGGQTSPGGETYNGVTVEMSSSPSSWSAPSTTFATNQGADNTLVYSGNIVCTAAAGNPSPNTYIIDIPLATTFDYDPTGGMDLCIEVDAPAPIPATMPNIAASSNSSHMARRVSTATQGAATGSASYFAAVVLMDYTPVPNAAMYTEYGAGCYDRYLSYYEVFPATPGVFDFNDRSIQMQPLGTAGSYTGYNVLPYVSPSAGNWLTPVNVVLTSAGAPLGDDELSAPQTLPFTFDFPGGSTTTIQVASNGFAFLNGTSTEAAAFYGNNAGLVTFGPRLCPAWGDLDPSMGGTVYFDIDPASGAAVATWENVPEFGTSSLNTLQVAIYPNNFVEYRIMTCTTDSPSGVLVGWSPGNGVRDPGSIDLSASLPFQTMPEESALALRSPNRPYLGNSFDLVTDNIPAATLFGAVVLSFNQLSPGVLLPGTGTMPGCYQHLNPQATFAFLPAGTSSTMTIPIPNDPYWIGTHVYAQSAALVPGINPLKAITSNGGDLLLDVN